MEKLSRSFKHLSLLFGLPLTLMGSGASADETESFTYMSQNPLTPIYSIPLEYTNYGGAQSGDVSVGSVKPIIPFSFDGWNLINQLSLNFIGTSGVVNGIKNLPEPYPGDGASGLGDTTLTSYVSPEISDDFSIGFGPALVFPTDTRFGDPEDRTSRQLGSGKFSAGPALMIVTQPKPWTVGLSVQQIWSVFGNNSRHGVSQMVLRPFVNYNFNDGWYLVSDMNMVANWNRSSDQTWTVPVGGGVGKLFMIGKNAINTKVEGYYNAMTPNLGADWSANLTLQVLFAK